MNCQPSSTKDAYRTDRFMPKAAMKKLVSHFLIMIFGLAFGSSEILAQDPRMNPNYNSHNRMMNRGHLPQQPKKPTQIQKNYNDPRYARHPSGGNVYTFDQRYHARAAAGEFWRITSDCASACTIGFGHFPKDRMCIAQGIRLGFHHGDSPTATAVMWHSYPADVKALVNAHGGMRPEWLWIPASAFYKIGYKPC